MEKIVSRGNSRIKYVKRLQSDRRFRRREGLFVIETNRWLQDALSLSVTPSLLLCCSDWAISNEGSKLLRRFEGPKYEIPDSLLAEVSEMETPAGFVALLPIPIYQWPTSPHLILILDQIRDPGNLGTIIRTAAAAAVDAIILTQGCVDPYNPKVVRATMGTLLRVPHFAWSWEKLMGKIGDLPRLLATGSAETQYDEIDWTLPQALIIGGEAAGASGEADRQATVRIKIDMANGVESLNAAVASSIILFEAARQRRR